MSRTLRRAVGAIVIAVLSIAPAVALPVAERVRFESLDRDHGQPVWIDGLLYRPHGAARSRPAVIALHGCGGLFQRGPRSAALTQRHAMHAQALLDAGYVVLLPDSFGSRGVTEICTQRTRERTIGPAKRRLDALGALRWLSAQPGVARERIALLGWSHGASTLLATIDAADPQAGALGAAVDAPPFFRAAVAFYPGCAASLRNDRWRPVVPTRILIGAADDWTPAQPCVQLAAKARERGWPIDTTIYEGAHHGFDAPGDRVVHRTDVPNGVHAGHGVHVGPDPAARADARRRVDAFLRETIGH